MAAPGEVEATARRHRGRLVRALVHEGLLGDPRWRDAFASVPRHEFLPRFFQPANPNGWTAVDCTDDDWLSQVYANRVLVTQLDGDPGRWENARRHGRVRGVPTSSSSMPAIMAVMLEALGGDDGDRVLEIGTGTGYNAALLCHRFGDALVSTVDIDAGLLATARSRLDGSGYHPTCVATDGAKGYLPTSPYDRILCTCAVSAVPLYWLAQTRPGGVIVTTLNRPLGAGLVRITAGEGPSGSGRVLADDGRFMPLRAHRRMVPEDLVHTLAVAPGPSRSTDLKAATVTSPASPFEFFAGLDLPGVAATTVDGTVLFLDRDGSWARHREDTVTEGGPRHLWDEIEASYTRWHTLGQPHRSRFGITVEPTHQELWLDTPESPHRWPLSAS